MPPETNPVEYLSVDELIALHARILGVPQEQAEHYVQQRERLAAALDRPANAAYYEEADLVRQAAKLLHGLVMAHGFIDGNKRAAWVATATFLALNGLRCTATVTERADLVVGIAEHAYDEQTADVWLRRHTSPD